MIRRRVISRAITQLQPLLGLNPDLSEFAIPLSVAGIEGDVIGITPVVESAANNAANVIVPEKCQPARAIRQQLCRVARILLRIQNRRISPLVAQTSPAA